MISESLFLVNFLDAVVYRIFFFVISEAFNLVITCEALVWRIFFNLVLLAITCVADILSWALRGSIILWSMATKPRARRLRRPPRRPPRRARTAFLKRTSRRWRAQASPANKVIVHQADVVPHVGATPARVFRTLCVWASATSRHLCMSPFLSFCTSENRPLLSSLFLLAITCAADPQVATTCIFVVGCVELLSLATLEWSVGMAALAFGAADPQVATTCIVVMG